MNEINKEEGRGRNLLTYVTCIDNSPTPSVPTALEDSKRENEGTETNYFIIVFYGRSLWYRFNRPGRRRRGHELFPGSSL
ncbi:hypothetical protein SK128_015145 [Halocaridina rubra]|uniref:Uncharacterized protein n=1 Tax=Halocaridina rubra TaxID=373956 RepID=A0AAN8ZWG3_HALRR